MWIEFCVSTWLKLAWYGPVIVPQRNPTLPWADIQCKVKWDRRAPKPQYRWSFPQINLHTVTTLNQYLHIFSKVFLIVRTMPRPTPMGIRHEVFAPARVGIKQGAIAARVGLTRATVNRILKRHAATGSLCRTRQGGLTTDSRPIKTTQCRRTCLFAIEYLLNDVRIFRQLWNLQDMFTTIFRFDLNSFGVYGVLGVEWGLTNPSRRTHDGSGQTHLSAYLMMLEYSDSYQNYRICSQQYLHSIWIVFGCMGCWGVGWGCQHRPDGPTTDPNRKFSKSTNMVI